MEQQLVQRLRAGEAAAYEQLVRDHAPRLLAVARRFLSQEADAQDALQDAFLSAFKGLANFQGDSRLGTWLHSIVVRAALMKLRTRRRHPEQSIEDLLPQFHSDGHRTDPGPAWEGDVQDQVQRQELRAVIRQCINQLPDSYRIVLLLRDIEEYDTQETARMLEESENVVKVRLHRARQALRTLLERRLRGGQ